MHIREIIEVLLRRWYLVAVPPLVAVALVAYQTVTAPPTAPGGYTATFRFTASQALDAFPDVEGDLQDVWRSSELSVEALTLWVQTSSFRAEVAQAVGDGVDLDPLGTAGDQRGSVGQVFLSHPSADALGTIAEAALDVLVNRSGDYFAQFGGEPAQVTLLDEIVVVPAPAPVVDQFEPVLIVGVAVLFGVVLAFVVGYLDPTVQTVNDLRRAGFEVLTGVPRE